MTRFLSNLVNWSNVLGLPFWWKFTAPNILGEINRINGRCSVDDGIKQRDHRFEENLIGWLSTMIAGVFDYKNTILCRDSEGLKEEYKWSCASRTFRRESICTIDVNKETVLSEFAQAEVYQKSIKEEGLLRLCAAHGDHMERFVKSISQCIWTSWRKECSYDPELNKVYYSLEISVEGSHWLPEMGKWKIRLLNQN